jgi:hypothetical protein
VSSATAVSVPVTYQIWIYDSCGETSAAIQTAVAAALAELCAALPIGGDVKSGSDGKLYPARSEGVIRGVYPDHVIDVSVTSPAGDTTLTESQVAVIGAVTPTVTIEAA